MAAVIDVSPQRLSPDNVMTIPEAETSRAINCLLLAFAADPLFRYIYDDPQDYVAGFPKFVSNCSRASFRHGTAYASGDYRSVALWSAPGARCSADTRAKTISRNVPAHRQAELSRVLALMDEARLNEPHWYLSYLGVEPSKQGTGVGSLLMAEVLAQVDKEKLPAFLESSNPQNIPFYERHGFVCLDPIDHANVPTITPMVRPARRT